MERCFGKTHNWKRTPDTSFSGLATTKAQVALVCSLAEKWVDKVYDIKRVSDRIMLIKLLVGEVVLTVLSVYAAQTGLEESQQRMHSTTDCKLSSQNYQIKK